MRSKDCKISFDFFIKNDYTEKNNLSEGVIMNVSEMVKQRKLPALLSREEMKQILLKEEYGFMPDIPYEVTVSQPRLVENRYCDKTVHHSTVMFTVSTQYGSHTIPVQQIIHTDGSVNPFFIFLNFRPDVPDRYYPTEEVAEEGFDILTVAYKDISSDDDDYTKGLAGIFLPKGRQKGDDPSKIAIWAWFASRMLDYAETLPCLDMQQAAVMGHSRLGKTALVAGMLDERFRYSFSNDSGCSGAALARGNTGNPGQVVVDTMDGIFDYERDLTTGESIRDIVGVFPHFSCKNYHKYAMTNITEGFDQHFLVAAIAPRFSYIASASRDIWADPVSEFLCGVAASEAYEAKGFKGLVHKEKLPEVKEHFHEGRIGYHLQKGPHFLSRHDWQEYMAFIRKHQDD